MKMSRRWRTSLLGIPFFESSAKLDQNVSDIFKTAAEMAVADMKKDPKLKEPQAGGSK